MFESCVGYSRVFLFVFVLIHIHHAVNMYPDLIGYLFFEFHHYKNYMQYTAINISKPQRLAWKRLWTN